MTRHHSRLSGETSPYLLRHAVNPVDWFPWGEAAFQAARDGDRPVFLSVGYSTCHFCHLMERESFEDPEIARFLNEHFVAVKVDREERPDIDDVYMTATSALGTGGWPMSVFLLPSGEPFFAGTYFPPRGTGGRPGFLDLLRRIRDLWIQERGELTRQAEELSAAVRDANTPRSAGGLSLETLRAARKSLERSFDPGHGGFGRAPKFPNVSAISLLIRDHVLATRSATERAPETTALRMAAQSLEAMMHGGICDHLGGGFFRYSTDERWRVPHFEKMVTDQAELARVYLEAFQLTQHGGFRRVVHETLDFVLRELRSPSGGFFSALDADTEGQEGKYYLWTAEELRNVCAEPAASHFAAFYGVAASGDVHGSSVLCSTASREEVARRFGIPEAAFVESLELAREAALLARSKRTPPELDDKILTAENGLLISVLCRAGLVLDEPRYLQAAEDCATFLWENLRDSSGRLLRAFRGQPGPTEAFAEDYANLALGFVQLHEATGELRYLERALELTQRLLADYVEPETQALSRVRLGAESLFARSGTSRDGASPPATATLACLLVRLSAHTGRPELRDKAEALLRSVAGDVKRSPTSHTAVLIAASELLFEPLSLVITGSTEHARPLLTAATRGLGVPLVLSRVLPGQLETSPLAMGRAAAEGGAKAYLCRGVTCQQPTTDPDELRAQIREALAAGSHRRELGRRVNRGRATPEATRAHLDRALVPAAMRRLMAGLEVAGIGVGTHRVGLDTPHHREALQTALAGGQNLIDTSPAYALGDSERLIGEVLESLAADGMPRESFVIATKLGVALGAQSEQVDQNSAWRAAAVPVSPGGTLLAGAFCLHPEFLARQLDDSRERLCVDHLDVVLIQGPEQYLASGRSNEELILALREVFLLLEDQVREGKVGHYGIMTATATRAPSDRVAIDPLKLRDLAAEVSGPGHHFRVVELPINLLERDALTPRSFDPALPSTSLCARLRAAGLDVWAARPLSGVTEASMMRLIDPPRDDAASPPSLSSARYKVASLEAEFETTLAPRLRLTGVRAQGPLLPIAGSLGRTLEQVETLEQFDLAESSLITPQIRGLLGQLDRAFGDDPGRDWARFRQAYVRAVGTYLAAVREVALGKNRAQLAALRLEIPTSPEFRELDRTRAVPLDFLGWSLGLLLDHPEISVVLLGQRKKKHAEAARDLLLSASPGEDARPTTPH